MNAKFLTRLTFLFLFFSIKTLEADAQSSVQPISKESQSVVLAVQQLTQAMIDADSIKLDQLCTAALSYGHSSGHVEGKKEFIKKITSGRSDFLAIDLTEQSISISGKTAIVRHNLHAKTMDKGNPGEVNLKVLLVWQKIHGIWKLLARQAVKNVV